MSDVVDVPGRTLQPEGADVLGGLPVSHVGIWVQFTTIAIVVDRLTGKVPVIGILTALQFAPTLFLGAGRRGVRSSRPASDGDVEIAVLIFTGNVPDRSRQAVAGVGRYRRAIAPDRNSRRSTSSL